MPYIDVDIDLDQFDSQSIIDHILDDERLLKKFLKQYTSIQNKEPQAFKIVFSEPRSFKSVLSQSILDNHTFYKHDQGRKNISYHALYFSQDILKGIVTTNGHTLLISALEGNIHDFIKEYKQYKEVLIDNFPKCFIGGHEYKYDEVLLTYDDSRSQIFFKIPFFDLTLVTESLEDDIKYPDWSKVLFPLCDSKIFDRILITTEEFIRIDDWHYKIALFNNLSIFHDKDISYKIDNNGFACLFTDSDFLMVMPTK